MAKRAICSYFIVCLLLTSTFYRLYLNYFSSGVFLQYEVTPYMGEHVSVSVCLGQYLFANLTELRLNEILSHLDVPYPPLLKAGRELFLKYYNSSISDLHMYQFGLIAGSPNIFGYDNSLLSKPFLFTGVGPCYVYNQAFFTEKRNTLYDVFKLSYNVSFHGRNVDYFSFSLPRSHARLFPHTGYFALMPPQSLFDVSSALLLHEAYHVVRVSRYRYVPMHSTYVDQLINRLPMYCTSLNKTIIFYDEKLTKVPYSINSCQYFTRLNLTLNRFKCAPFMYNMFSVPMCARSMYDDWFGTYKTVDVRHCLPICNQWEYEWTVDWSPSLDSKMHFELQYLHDRVIRVYSQYAFPDTLFDLVGMISLLFGFSIYDYVDLVARGFSLLLPIIKP